MTRTQGRSKRALASSAAVLLLIAACGGTTPTVAPTAPPVATTPVTAPTGTPATQATGTPGTTQPSGTPITAPTATPLTQPTGTPTTTEQPTGTPSGPVTPTKGGTMYMLVTNSAANGGVSFNDMDPQRIYTGEDLAFFGATMIRSLTGYKYTDDPTDALTIVPDAATDTGTHNADFTQWSFTLKDGMKWQDGSAVNCEDFKYGASRVFAQDVLADGPTYAIQYFDIPTDSTTGASKYPGPYSATPAQQALFDKAVSCDGSTITYKLKVPVVDFNFTVTLGLGAVPNPTDHPGADTGESYTTAPWSDGPYMIQSFNAGVGGSLILTRNPNWDPATDTYRGAYPDTWEVDFGIDAKLADQRLMQPTGNDEMAVQYGTVQPENLSTVFSDAHTAQAQYAGRAFSDYDPYQRYLWIRTDKITDPLVREAMAVGLDRDAIRTAEGGDFVGDYADGAIKPNIGQDYAPTGLWDPTTGAATADSLWGQAFPASGSADLAKQLIAQSTAAGTTPHLSYNYVSSSAVAQQVAAIVQSSLDAAGFDINLVGVSEHYYSYVLNTDTQGSFGGAGWGPDWPNASTVIPDLFTDNAGFNLSRVSQANQPDFYAAINAALAETDRTKQAADWQALNVTAAKDAFIIPTFAEYGQTIAGDKVGNLYRWSPYGSWPYAELFVKP